MRVFGSIMSDKYYDGDRVNGYIILTETLLISRSEIVFVEVAVVMEMLCNFVSPCKAVILQNSVIKFNRAYPTEI